MSDDIRKLLENFDRVDEGLVFRSAQEMVRHMMSDLVEAHMEAEGEDPDSVITELLGDLVKKYQKAKIR